MMPENPKLSIIIPTLNEASVIKKTLRQFRECKSHRVELIVSDGGSHDGTPELARQYADKVLVYNGEVRQTIAMGRNAGAEEATGDILIFFDADITLLDPDAFFDTALEVFRTRPDVVAMSGKLQVLPDMARLSDRFFFTLVDWLYVIQNNALHIGAASGEFQMVRQEMFRKLGGYNERLAAGEDQEMFRRLSREGRTYFNRHLTVYHTGRRVHKTGWPRLILIWLANGISVPLFGRSWSKVWEEIR